MISLFKSNSSDSSPWPEQDGADGAAKADPKPQTHRTLAPNLTRRSHKKSRAGCFNCKTRKIKVLPGPFIMNLLRRLSLTCSNVIVSGGRSSYLTDSQCQETRPCCENCTLKELECKYPTKADQHLRRRTDEASSAMVFATPSVSQPSLTTSEAFNFTLTDLKFFHHFLVVAHPHLPLGNEKVWVQKIPVFAQEVRRAG